MGYDLVMDSAEEEKTALLAPGSIVSSQSYVGTGAGKGGKQDSDEEEERPGEEHDEEEHDEEEEPIPYKNENDLFTYQLQYMRFLSGCCCQNTAFWNPTPWIKNASGLLVVALMVQSAFLDLAAVGWASKTRS